MYMHFRIKCAQIAWILIFFLVNWALESNGEGTKQVIPLGTAPLTPGGTGAYGSLALTTGTLYSTFANYNAAAEYRLYIHIESTSEKILFGFQKETNTDVVKFNIHEPASPYNISFTGTVPSGAGTGYIQDISHAYAGPFPASGGYTPFEFVPTMTGDWFIEFFTTNLAGQNTAVSSNLFYFDITVLKSGYQSPPVPADAQDGRVWSKSWQFNSVSVTPNPDKHFAGSVYVLSNDSIVTMIDFNKMLAGTFMVFCNPKGVQNIVDPLLARKSQPGNYKFPDYKVFLNDPDQLVYPNGTPGTISSNPAPTMTPADPPCSGNENITFSVTKDGNVDITLELPLPYANKIFTQVAVVSGSNIIPWNGFDGGSPAVPVADGTPVTMSINYLNGLTNLPLYDVEYTANPNYTDQGLKVTLVRPTTGVQTPRMYWDDSEVNKTSTTCRGGTNTSPGCVPSIVTPTDGCHKWEDCLGNINTINTWWYAANSSAAGILVQHNAEPPNPAGINANRCGSGMVTINATVLNNEVVDWYSDAAGTILVQTGTSGNTSFTTPNLSATTTYYAMSRNLTTGCLSPGLTAVLAEVFNAPAPPAGITNVTQCGSQSVTLTAIVGSGATVEWWDAPAGGNSLGTNPTYITTVLVPGSYTYYAEAVTSQPVCSRSPRTAYYVVIQPIPVITLINPPSSICTGILTSLDLNNTFTASLPGTSFTWTVLPGNCTNILNCPAGGSGTNINDLLTLNNSILGGQVIYSITPTLAGCLGTAIPITVPVNPVPSPAGAISPSLPNVCQNESMQYSIDPILNADDYYWSVAPSAAASLVAVNPAAHYEVSITWDGSYTGVAVVHVRGHNGCGDGPDQTQTLTIRPKPVVTVKQCEDIVTTTQGRLIRMKWGLPIGGKYSMGGTDFPDNVTFDPKNAGGAGNKLITYTYTNQYQCENTASLTILVKPAPAFIQCGTSSIMDVRTNGLSYTTMLIGTGASARCWMTANLAFGSLTSKDLPQSDNCYSEKYCLRQDVTQCKASDMLYQWDELMQYEDPALGYQDLCMPGWHVPTTIEWQGLIDFTASKSPGDGIAADFLKYGNGFNTLVNGIYYINNTWAFSSGNPAATMFWTSTQAGSNPIARGLNTINPSVSIYESSKANAFPVRCVKD